jgi:Cu-Zn family superoxide dismutase
VEDACFVDGEAGECTGGFVCGAGGTCGAPAFERTEVFEASCELLPDDSLDGNNLRNVLEGKVTFSASSGTTGVSVNVYVKGLPNGEYAAHLHEFGDLRFGSTSAGGHWAGGNPTHGTPEMGGTIHLGDLGNFASVASVLNSTKVFPSLRLSGASSVLGRSFLLKNFSDTGSGYVAASATDNTLAHCVVGVAAVADPVTQVAAASGPTTTGPAGLACAFSGTSACASLSSGVDCLDVGETGFMEIDRLADGNVTVRGKIAGFATARYGIHIHEYGDLSAADGTGTGGHFNPLGVLHGLPGSSDEEWHAGDLGNVGAATGNSFVSNGAVNSGYYEYSFPSGDLPFDSLVGRAITLHSGVDSGSGEFCSQSGSSGTRVLHCVIGHKNTDVDRFRPIILPPEVDITNVWQPLPCPPPPTPMPGAAPVSEYWDPTQSRLLGDFLDDWRDTGDCDDEKAGCPDRVLAVAREQALTFTLTTFDFDGEPVQVEPTPEIDVEVRLVGENATSEPVERVATAHCALAGTDNDPGISGEVTFVAARGGVNVTVDIAGVTVNPDAAHAIHIHTFGDIRDGVAGSSAGGHWIGGPNVAQDTAHGCPGDGGDRHHGDMGNWTAVGGVISATKGIDELGSLMKLFGTDSLIGRAVVLHELADECTGAAGNAGTRLATCVIGRRVVDAATQQQAARTSPANRDRLVARQDCVVHDGISCIRDAVAVLEPTDNCEDTVPTDAACARGSLGTVWFSAENAGGVTVRAQLFGLDPARRYGFHVHEFGDLSNVTTGTSTGSHLNPSNRVHALPDTRLKHMGDMGNVQTFDGDGVAWYEYTFPLMEIDHVIGGAVVLHALPDKGDGSGCDQAGSAGPRFAFGVVGIRNPTGVPQLPAIPSDLDFGTQDAVVNCDGTGGGAGLPVTVGVCHFVGTDAEPTLTGTATFVENVGTGKVSVSLDVSGVTKGLGAEHGVHVHEAGDIRWSNASSTGSHWNPDGNDHGCPGTAARHAGDMGKFIVSAEGTTVATKTGDDLDGLLALRGEKSIIGRAVVFHELADDCATVASSGARLGQCVVGIANPGEASDNLAAAASSFPDGTVAVAHLTGTAACADCTGADGVVWLTKVVGGTMVEAKIEPGRLSVDGAATYGMHIHAWGDLGSEDGTATGGHFNPTADLHGLPGVDDPLHAGDLGSLQSIDADDGHWYRATWSHVPFEAVVGRAIVVHAGVDGGRGDFCSQSGSSGARLLTGVLGLASDGPTAPTLPAGDSDLTYAAATCPSPPASAVCVLRGTETDPTIEGNVTFTQDANGYIDVAVVVSGITVSPDAEHGLHVHQWGDISNRETGASAGSHFVGTLGGTEHGCPPSASRHVGDLGNFQATAGAIDATRAAVTDLTGLLRLFGTDSIVGRSLALHSAVDGCASDSTFGNILAHCTIGAADYSGDTLAAAVEPDSATTAIAVLQGTSGCEGVAVPRAPATTAAEACALGTAGEVRFTPVFGGVRITARIPGLDASSSYGFHLHEVGDLTAASGATLRGHYNPDGEVHGLPGVDDDRHAGDLGMIQSFAGDGVGYYDNVLPGLTVDELVGRGVVVHGLPDNGRGEGCDPATGNAGPRILVGVIGTANAIAPISLPNIAPNNVYIARDCTKKRVISFAHAAHAASLAKRRAIGPVRFESGTPSYAGNTLTVTFSVREDGNYTLLVGSGADSIDPTPLFIAVEGSCDDGELGCPCAPGASCSLGLSCNDDYICEVAEEEVSAGEEMGTRGTKLPGAAIAGIVVGGILLVLGCLALVLRSSGGGGRRAALRAAGNGGGGGGGAEFVPLGSPAAPAQGYGGSNFSFDDKPAPATPPPLASLGPRPNLSGAAASRPPPAPPANAAPSPLGGLGGGGPARAMPPPPIAPGAGGGGGAGLPPRPPGARPPPGGGPPPRPGAPPPRPRGF